MDRSREARRASIVGSNGFNRRRHRTNSLRDSPDEDGGLDLQESVRLRDRVKKDRDRDRERERDRERDRERNLRERSSRSKRRRAERLTSNRDDTGGDETSEESVNDDEDEEDEENNAGAVRLLTPAIGSINNHHQNHHVHVSNHHHSHSSSFSQQQQQQQHNNNNNNNNNNNSIVSSNNHHLQHRKTFPPSSSSSFAKVLRAPPVWKSGDEMISVPVPRKARSVSKRSHDWISSSSNNNSGGGVSSGGDQNPAQPSSSPARQNHVSTSTAPLPPPTSPSSSNVSIRKKLKHSFNNTTGPKLKPPKVSSSKPSSSNPEELEIEIAEVLYGLMTQSQGPSSSSKKEDSREVNRLNSDAKPLNSPPISNYISIINPILGPNSSPLSAVPPKRKRPRQVSENSSYGARSSPISAKADIDQTPKSEISSPNVEKISRSAAENGCEVGGNSVIPQGQPPVLTAPELITSDSELKPVPEESRINRDLVVKEDVSSSKEQESAAVRAHDSNNRDSPLIVTVLSAAAKINTNLMVSEIENQKEEKFEIDLMEPPPPPHQVRSSPERESKIDLRASAVVDQKPVLSFLDVDLKPVVVSKDNEDRKGNGNDNLSNVAAEEKKCEDAESNKAIENKGRNIDLHLDLENPDRDVSSINENKSQLQTQKQQQPQMPLKATKEEPPTEKPGHSTSSMPLPMSMASWPGGLPPMGYMTPMQGVVSMDGGSVTPAHLQQQPLFSQPRPKRCATHCHIARNIHCLHQFMKMNPFWPAPAGSSASLFGSKPCNLNVGAPADLSVSVRGVNNALDKGPSLASVPNGGKEKSYHSASSSDSTQRKQQQILIQQALPPVAPSNLLGPTFIFPLNHQQQSAMAARPATAKPPTTAASSNTTPTPAATTSSPAPTPMSFNYPNMSPNETQYLAILQNNAYPFPIPTVGAPPPNYRGGPAQAMPLFNGSFYSSQIIHHQQLQHSQQPSNQPPQLMQAPHQNASASNNSSPSQKHIQSQQQRPPPQSSGHASLQNNFNSQKAQQSHTQYMHGSEDSSSTNDNRGSRAASMNIYGQNFTLPIHPQSFALMTPPPAALSTANSNQNEKKSHQTQQLQQQQQGLKTGVDSLPPHTFAMSFGPINGTPAGPVGIDTSSMAQNLPTFQNCPEAARQNIQMMAVAAQVAQKNFRISEDNGKSGNVDSSSKDDERKSFSSIQVNSMMESSARSLTVGSGPTRTSRPATTNGMMGAVNVVPNAQVQAQIQQQMLQLKQQQQQMAANAVNRTKVPVTNGSIYSEHLNSSTMVGGPKFPNAISPFPQNHPVHSSSTSPSQSPQWKSSTRTSVPQGPPSVSMHKNIPQQHSRTQHAQISFGGNQKQSATSQGQQVPPPTSNQVGSPTTSSLSKGTSGSPRTTSSASTNNKTGHGSSFSAQPPKNSPSMHSQKSPSILGNPHGAKNQMQQQPQPKAMQQQAQLFFSNPYSQSQSPHSMSTTSLATAGPSGYYMPQRRPDQHQRPPGAPPVSLSNTSTNDPATAIAAATCNVKGRGFSSQSVIHGSPFGAQSMGMMLPAGFSYVHPVQAGVQVKPAEQKQPAGNDSLHQWQPEKK